MLAQAQQADIAMAPAADMFEMGVKVQVLKRGTMFAMRAAKLYDLYRNHDSLDQIPGPDRRMLEKTLFRAPLEEIWEQTRGYFSRRDPAQIERGERDPKHKMALVFRWYLGQSSHWANVGEPARSVDYQIWCGPAMAAFNDWVRGSFLEQPENRRVVTVALNILFGAAVLSRARMLRAQGVPLAPGMPRLAPLDRGDIEKRSQTSYHGESCANR
jgi:PfaD family protein